ncbi:uncharacterized protein LOC100202097 isoform X1 [Hydra vulgaris]|uniref:uncharacterized protein LOC100202097 isoform X1 n=1 Tax=Hydra vulgaris TaxID=6087 RepID=UPI0002B460A6|nr:uncharacterized protein LOC100202097 isoform X1 [Hydra vulgaris]
MFEGDTIIDLEEAVGSYLNCLSTSFAAGSKLYASVGTIIEEKFQEIFPNHDSNKKLVKMCFQTLQTLNAFEGYQKALLDCKEKLLEILTDNHTKKHDRNCAVEDEEYADVALRVAKELYCYHQTVADVLKPLLFSNFQEDFPTLSSDHQHVLRVWTIVSEANKPLRQGFGLTNEEIAQILSWQHGEDLSESCRKKLNFRISTLIQQYVDRLFKHGVCEVEIPLSFSIDSEELNKVLQDCCSPTDIIAASSLRMPTVKEEIEVTLQRELPRMTLCLNGHYYDKANPGKAFENTTLKMRAVKEAVLIAIKSASIEATKEQVDTFCLHILTLSSIPVSSASSRTAVMMAFGKCNLVQVKPLINLNDEKIVYMDVEKHIIHIDVPSKWCIVEDTSLFKPLCRDSESEAIATVHVSYHVTVNVENYFKKRIEALPVVQINQCVLSKLPSSQVKKDQAVPLSKSIKIQLTKATSKFFQIKSLLKVDGEHYRNTEEQDNEVSYIGNNESLSESHDDEQPIPPPRLKRKAKKSKKAKEKERKAQEEKKDDLAWFSTSTKFNVPPLPTLTDSKDLSPSVASFEELQGVINFLSGSSSSSLTIEKCEKRHPVRTISSTSLQNDFTRTISSTSLQNDHKNNKNVPEGKKKLTHKRSASFSGNANDLKEVETLKVEHESLKTPSVDDIQHIRVSSVAVDAPLNNFAEAISNVLKTERTPGDGMDQRDKNTSSANVSQTADSLTVMLSDTNSSSKVLNSAVHNSVVQDSNQSVIQDSKGCENLVDENSSVQSDATSPLPDWYDQDLSNNSLTQDAISNETLSLLPTFKSTAPSTSKLTINIDDTDKTINLKVGEQVPKTTHVNKEFQKNNIKSSINCNQFEDVHENPVYPISGGVSPSFFQNESVFSETYQPFNSNTSWSMGLQNTGLSSLWSDATLDKEKPVITSEHITSEKFFENQFTPDKQQDFQKLLEGSRFFADYQTSESWKDRPVSSMSFVTHKQDQQKFFEPAPDPWPLQSENKSLASFHINNTQYIQSRSIESLQLPPNPTGPYMRQNREQLLAKQQILEQYARQQKRQQIQHQQTSSLNQYQSAQKKLFLQQQILQQQHNSIRNIDRVASVPPGYNERISASSNQRYDFDRLLSQRVMSQQKNSFNLGSHQSRSVSDIRTENNLFPATFSSGFGDWRFPINEQLDENSIRY